MAEENITAPIVETAQPPVQPEGAAVQPDGGQGAATENQAPRPFYERANEKFQGKFTNDDEFLDSYGRLQGEYGGAQQKLSEYEQKLKAAEMGSIPALRELERYVAAQGKDEKENFRLASEYLREAATNYNDLAVSDPKAVIAKALRAERPNYEDGDIAESIGIKEREYRRDGIELGLDGDELDAHVHKRMVLDAKGYAPTLEKSKPTLDFKAAGQPDPVAQTAAQEKWVAENHERFKAVLDNFKGIDLGGEMGSWEINLFKDGGVNPKYQPIAEAIRDPSAFMNSLTDGSHYNYQRIARLAAIESLLPEILAAKVEEAAGEARNKLITERRNGGFGNQSEGSGVQGGAESAVEFVKRNAHLASQL